MRNLIILILLSASFGYSQDYEWAYSAHSIGQFQKMLISPDNNGGTFAVYPIIGDSIAPDPTQPNNYVYGPGTSISRLDANGALIWNKVITGYSYINKHNVADIETLSDGSFIMVSTTRNASYPLDLDPSNNVFNVYNDGMIISHYDENGNIINIKKFNINTSIMKITSVSISDLDEILISGNFSHSAHFSNIPNQDTITANNVRRTFVAKYDTNLDLVWVDYFICPLQITYSSYATQLACFKPNGNVVLMANFSDSVLLNNNQLYNSGGVYDNILVEYNSNGVIINNFQYLNNPTSSNIDSPHAIIADPNNKLIVIAKAEDSTEIDLTGNYTPYSKVKGIYFVIYDNDFNLLHYKIDRGGNSRVREIAISSSNEIVIAGTLRNDFDFMNFTHTSFWNNGFYVLTANGGYDPYLAKYDTTLTVLYAHHISENSNWGDVKHMKLDSNDNIFITGNSGTGGIVDMDFGPIVENVNLLDGKFIAKYNWCDGVKITQNIDACLGDSYTFPDGTSIPNLVNSTTNESYFSSVSSCDSIIETNVTVHQPAYTVDSVLTCSSSYTWIDGVTYTSSNNTATHTLSTLYGCDSIITLNLTISNPAYTTDTQVACDSFTWIDGNTYTSSNNTAQHILSTTSGCDSIVTLDLTLNLSNYTTDTINACDSYTWIDGNTYTSSTNTPTFITGVSANGCDEVQTLDLTITNSTTSVDAITSCTPITWIDGITYSASNNTASYILTNSIGCDSIVTLNFLLDTVDVSLTIIDPTIMSNAVNASHQWLNCDNGYAVINGSTFDTYTPNVNGNYAVEVTQYGCIDTSECVEITTVGIETQSIFNEILIYPNPTESNITIDFGDLKNGTIIVRDLKGKILFKEKNIKTPKYDFKIEGDAGVYFVEIKVESIIYHFKIVKE